ncbi:hypothetical protein VNO77_33710 [Canavalia gladiata]|uniref:Uncharacterized protein n=1 Tax=Canavalia gladiata TaxID=3824 RepID=A0AAN9KCC1_CANGL
MGTTENRFCGTINSCMFMDAFHGIEEGHRERVLTLSKSFRPTLSSEPDFAKVVVVLLLVVHNIRFSESLSSSSFTTYFA